MMPLRQNKHVKNVRKDREWDEFLSPNAGDQWVQFGWVPRSAIPNYSGSIWFTPFHRVVLFLIFLVQSSFSFYYGPENKNSILFNYDVWALLGSKAIWLYCRSLVCFTSFVMILTPFAFPKFESEIEFIFSCLKGQSPISLLELNDKNLLKQFLQISHFFYKWFSTVVLIGMFPLNLLGYLYIKNLPSIHFVFFALILIPYQYLVLVCGAGFLAVVLVNFLVVVAYSQFLFQSWINRISSTLERASKYRSRKLMFRLLMESEIKHQTRFFRLLSRINRFYRKVISLVLPYFICFALTAFYAFKQGKTFEERFLFVIPCCFASLNAMFNFVISASLVRRSRRLYKLNHKCMQEPLPLRLKWHLMLTIEYLSSKRNRVAFYCSNWFVLSNWSLVKVRRIRI